MPSWYNRRRRPGFLHAHVRTYQKTLFEARHTCQCEALQLAHEGSVPSNHRFYDSPFHQALFEVIQPAHEGSVPSDHQALVGSYKKAFF
jgi:hypothetical protein